jgi:hypothetical protein
LPVEQAKVNPPGIQAEAREAFAHLSDRCPNAFLDFTQQAQNIPMQPVWQSHRIIIEAMYFYQVESIAVEFTQNSTTAFCSQIYCQVIRLVGHRGLADII